MGRKGGREGGVSMVHGLRRDRSEEAVRNELRWMPCLPPKTMMLSGPQLLPRAMTWSKAVMHLWESVLLFMAPVITEGPMDIWSLGPDL